MYNITITYSTLRHTAKVSYANITSLQITRLGVSFKVKDERVFVPNVLKIVVENQEDK